MSATETGVGIVPSPSQVVPQCEEITTIHFFIVKSKVKISLLQTMEAHRVARG
jgi:hypothetical protein